MQTKYRCLQVFIERTYTTCTLVALNFTSRLFFVIDDDGKDFFLSMNELWRWMSVSTSMSLKRSNLLQFSRQFICLKRTFILAIINDRYRCMVLNNHCSAVVIILLSIPLLLLFWCPCQCVCVIHAQLWRQNAVFVVF